MPDPRLQPLRSELRSLEYQLWEAECKRDTLGPLRIIDRKDARELVALLVKKIAGVKGKIDGLA